MKAESFVRDYATGCYVFDGNAEDYFVAKLIYKYMRGGRVLDLGSGPVVPITSIFYPNASEVVAVDLLPENLAFVEKHADELQPIVARARAYRHRYLSKKEVHPKLKLIEGDVTKRLKVGAFDAVMNLGCFGALDTSEEFFAAVAHAAHYLKKGGTLLMVNWVGNVKRPHHFNGKVYEPDVFVPSLLKAGLRIEELHMTKSVLSEETRKKGYEAIIWAVARK